jgi:hypothetical protein
MPATRTAQALARLLDRRNQHPEHLQAIDREIWLTRARSC